MAKELARLEISTVRRILGTGIQAGLGVFLCWESAVQLSASAGWRAVLALLGLALLYLAWRFWNASKAVLILSKEGLTDSFGRHLFTLEQIKKIDRGLFAFKPASGFVVITKTPLQRGWVPGLWWAFGHRIGIGGATARPAGKQMADIMSVLITDRGAEIMARDDE